MARSQRKDSSTPSEQESRSSGHPERLVALVGLLGALLGALGGFGGSLLVYNQGTRSQDLLVKQRLADIRRVAYSDFVAQTQSLRQSIIDFNNAVYLKKTGEDLVSASRASVEPEGVKYARAVTAVVLVASEPVRKASDAVGGARDDFARLISAAIAYRPSDNTKTSPYNASEFQARLDNYDKTVRDFVQAARNEVI